MLSQMANAQSSNDNQKNILHKVSSNAKETMERMSDIVWMIKPGESETGSLKQRMERFGFEICGSKNISLQMDLAALDHLKPGMEQRKNIYLIFKEAINNAVKYSGTPKIEVSSTFANGQMQVTIKDFGKGFDASKASRGNGLDNMKNRAKDLGGDLTVNSEEDGGTEVSLQLTV